jgi:hypothetical protein
MKKAYDDDVAVTPRDLIAAAKERADVVKEFADLGFHCFAQIFFYYKEILSAFEI